MLINSAKLLGNVMESNSKADNLDIGHYITISILIAIIYFIFAMLGFFIIYKYSEISFFWPAAGWAIFSLLRFGIRFAPSIVIGAFFANFYHDMPAILSLGIGISSTSGAILGSFIFNKIVNSSYFSKESRLFASYLVCGFFAPVLSSLLGVLTILFGKILVLDAFNDALISWWSGDAIGILFITPFLNCFFSKEHSATFKNNHHLREAAAWCIGSLAIGYLIFFKSTYLAHLFLIFIYTYLAWLRTSERTIQIIVSIFTTFALIGTYNSSGPFQYIDVKDNLISVQIFLITYYVTTLGFSPLLAVRSNHLVNWMILVIWLLSACGIYFLEKIDIQKNESHFQELVNRATSAIEDRIATYEDILRAAASYVTASSNVLRSEWQTYVKTLNLIDRYPGINGIGVITPISRKKLKDFVENERKDKAPDFNIKYVNKDGIENYEKLNFQHYVIKFIEPLEMNLPAQGLDIGSELNRRRAAELSRDTGLTTMTKKIILVQDNKKGAGFLVFHPVYKNNKKKFVGWVYAPFIADKFFSKVIGDFNKELMVTIYDDDKVLPENILFQNEVTTKSKKEMVTKIKIDQREIIAIWKVGNEFITVNHIKTVYVFALFGTISLLLANIIASLQLLKDKDEALERNKIYQAKKGLEEQVYALNESAIVAITDIKGKIVYVNDNFEKITGYSKDEILGKDHRILNSEYHSKEFFEKLWSTISQGKVWRGDIRNKNKHGNFYWVDTTIVPMKDINSNVQEYIAIRYDITEKKAAEKRLIEANHKALAAAKAKSEFLANMSHEIRTPMNAIIAMADLLSDTSLTPDQETYVSLFKGAGDNLLRILNDVLDLSKIDNEQFRVENNPFNLKKCVNDVISICHARAIVKKIELNVLMVLDIDTVIYGDELRLKQILLNLIGNAIKFTDIGSVRLEIMKNYYSEHPGNLLFKIVDTGIGISNEQKNKLFSYFSQADASVTKKYGGTGLGLAISKKLVEALNGEIWIESDLGKGSIFYFTIDCKVLANKGVDINEDSKIGSSSSIDFRKLEILLVDDVEDNRFIIKEYLKKTNYNITEADNGKSAIEILTQKKFDLIFMDMQMPILDGYSATRAIREMEKSMGLSPNYIVALTAYALEEELNKSIEAGCNTHMTKPIKRSALLEMLQTFKNKI